MQFTRKVTRKSRGRGAVAGVFAEGAFLDLVVGADLALDDDLGVGRHFEVVGLALHQPRRLAGKHADQFRLGDRRGRAGRHGRQRREADGGGEWAGQPARQVVLGELLAEVGEGEDRARHGAPVEHHLPVHAPVHVAAHRMLGHHRVPGADIAAAVAVMHQRHRQFAQVNVGAQQDVLLAGRVLAVDHHRRDRLAVGALEVFLADLGQARRRVHAQRDRHAAVGGQGRAEVAEARIVLDLFHEGRGGAQFAGAAHDGAGLVFPIHFLLDAHGVAGLDAGLDELPIAPRC
jgi:hypothetical protein